MVFISSARKSLPCRDLPARSRNHRAISMMSLGCLYCWIFAYFMVFSCVSVVGFVRVIADMPLLHLFFFLNGVNSNDNDNNNNNNWLVDWILLPQLHKRSVEPWKLCLILSSFELLRSSLRILGRLIPNGF